WTSVQTRTTRVSFCRGPKMNRRSTRWCAAAALLVALSASELPIAAAAEDMQSIAVLSFAGYDRFVAAFTTLGETAKYATLPAAIGGFLRRRTGIESLEGLDRSRPMGVVVVTDGLAVVPIAFVPVADGEKLLRSLEKLIAKPEKLGEG